MTTISTVGILSVAASANYVNSSYASFEWNSSYCTIKNTTNTNRRMEAFFEVYEKNTGVYVENSYKSAIGAYGTTATACNPRGYSSMYTYRWIGLIYNGPVAYSGVVSSFNKP